MTLPDERYRAVMWAKSFLQALAYDKTQYPRMPNDVRRKAQSILRHFPSEYDMQIAAFAAPNIFAEKMEPVTRLMAQYEKSKKHE